MRTVRVKASFSKVAPLDKEQFQLISRATELAITRVLSKGTVDVFKPPTFAHSIEAEILNSQAEEFRKAARTGTIAFLKTADLRKERIGPTRRGLVTKDQNSFRQCAWLDPFDAVKYLATAYLLFEKIEAHRIPKSDRVVHSHRLSSEEGEIFDPDYGYDSFRARSSELSKERIGKWKCVTDISNFFDRIGNHSLENHLLNVGCDSKYVTLIREVLLFWAGDRRSYGVPVGSDASRILSEAVLLNVDLKLRDSGIVFVRYVDDFRIFSDTRAEALKAIEILTNLLADEGLSLNSKKTDIYRIVDPEEISQYTNRFAAGEHEQIDVTEKIEVKLAVRVSGRSAISRFYREPGREALKKIQAIPKDVVLKDFLESSEADVEQQIKLVVKYFVYADQDVNLLLTLIDRRITSIFYITDALVKEADRFSEDKREEIKVAVFGAPAVESVSLVVAWFGDDLRAGSCKVRPGVEVSAKSTTPAIWSVNGVSRANAFLVSRDDQDRPVYGGTPSDFAVVQAIQEMKARGLRVTFYPFILMDVPPGNTLPNPYSDNATGVGQPTFPWRGRITCSPAPGYAGSVDKTATAASQVAAFFGSASPSDFAIAGDTVSWTGPSGDWGLRRMMLHYAHLCAMAGGVDAFLIGSEMRGLTTIRSGASSYPAVTAFKALAADVRTILGAGTEIGYAADWSEYFGHHPGDGSGDVYFHLDPLWSDADIGFVGIDNYMPLSDWRDGFGHADAAEGWPAIYDRAYLQANIAGREGFDWFYASAADRSEQVLTPITDGAAGKPWVFATRICAAGGRTRTSIAPAAVRGLFRTVCSPPFTITVHAGRRSGSCGMSSLTILPRWRDRKRGR